MGMRGIVRSALAGLALASFLAGCAASQSSSTYQLVTPNGLITMPCRAQLVAASLDPDRLAATCGDGTLHLFSSSGRKIAETPNSFLLNSIGFAGGGENLEAFEFQPGLPGVRTPRLNAYNVYRGGVRQVPIPAEYATDMTLYATLDDQGHCMALARLKDRVRLIYDLAVFPSISPPNQPAAFSDTPAMVIEADGMMVAGMGSPFGASVRCVGARARRSPFIVGRNTIRAADGTESYQLHIYNASGIRTVRQQGSFRLISRTSGTEMALVDESTGRLAQLDAATGQLFWLHNSENRRWLDYDISVEKGVALRDSSGATDLVLVDCSHEPCAERLISSAVGSPAGVNMVVTSGGGFLTMSHQSNSYDELGSPRLTWRWVN